MRFACRLPALALNGLLSAAIDRMRQALHETARHVLVIESDESRRAQILDLVGNGIVHAQAVASVADAVTPRPCSGT